MDTHDLEQIRSIRSRTISTLGELATSPKPSYKIDNYELSWNDYQKQLTATVDWCDRKLAENAPYEFRSEGIS